MKNTGLSLMTAAMLAFAPVVALAADTAPGAGGSAGVTAQPGSVTAPLGAGGSAGVTAAQESSTPLVLIVGGGLVLTGAILALTNNEDDKIINVTNSTGTP